MSLTNEEIRKEFIKQFNELPEDAAGWFDAFKKGIAYTSAIEQKYQAQIAELKSEFVMLRNLVKEFHGAHFDAYKTSPEGREYLDKLADAINDTQATAEAFIAEVKAGALEEAAKKCANLATANWYRYGKGADACEKMILGMAAELRNQQPAQPRKPCTCDGRCEELHYNRAEELQRQLDEAAKQEPVCYANLWDWTQPDGSVQTEMSIEYADKTPPGNCKRYRQVPLYRHPPNLPALIEQATSEYREDALRYRVLRNQDVDDNFPRSGLFIGCIPDNEVLTEEDADAAIDAIRARK